MSSEIPPPQFPGEYQGEYPSQYSSQEPSRKPSQSPELSAESPGRGLGAIALLLVSALALGALMSLIWWQVAPQPQLVVTEDGIYPQDFYNASWFGADGWFLLLGAAAGLVLAVLAWSWCRQRPMIALATLVLGGALVALTAWWLGGLLGPPDPSQGDIAVGETVPEPLGLRALGVLFAPAVVAVATFVVLAAALPPAEAEPGG